MNINYEYYKIFYYVAKHNSFTEAARILLNNQPNLTRMIKKLENELGCTLFLRQRHGVTLTPEGEKLYKHISIAFEHILQGEQEIAKDKSLQSGIITIAASEIALHCILLPILKEFRNSYPGIHIKILNHSTPQAIEVLKNGLVDFAIITEPFEIPADISSKILRSIQEVPICSNTLFLTMVTPFVDKTLAHYPLIGLGKKTSSYAFYSEFFNKMNLPFSPDVEVATADQILPMVKSDLGIGFVPTDFLNKENMENIAVLDMKEPVPKRNICMLKKKGTSLSIAASELENMIHQNTRKEQTKD